MPLTRGGRSVRGLRRRLLLTTTAGHALATEFAKACDGPNGFVKAIREQIQHGVDHIKLNLSGGIMGPRGTGIGIPFSSRRSWRRRLPSASNAVIR